MSTLSPLWFSLRVADLLRQLVFIQKNENTVLPICAYRRWCAYRTLFDLWFDMCMIQLKKITFSEEIFTKEIFMEFNFVNCSLFRRIKLSKGVITAKVVPYIFFFSSFWAFQICQLAKLNSTEFSNIFSWKFLLLRYFKSCIEQLDCKSLNSLLH